MDNIKKYKKGLKYMVKICLLLSLMVFGIESISGVKVSAAGNPYPQTYVDNGVYHPGNCTWQVWEEAKNRLGIELPNWGNAGGWCVRARNSGYTVVDWYNGYVPPNDCIIEWAGHVGWLLSADSVGVNIREGNVLINGSWQAVHEQWWSWDTLRAYRGNPKGVILLGNNPQGCFDIVNGGQGNIQVRGWAFDRDNVNTAIKIHVYIGGPAGSGAEGYEISTGTLREDVNAAYPGVGNNHGFDTVIATNRVGEQQVYVYAINIGSGNNVLLGHKTVTIYPPATPTPAPTPTLTPTPIPTPTPTMRPMVKPTISPTVKPTTKPTIKPTTKPTVKPTPKSQGDKNATAKNTQDTYRNEVSAPGITTVKACKSYKHGKVYIKWYKVTSANGYQIQYSTKKNFVRKKTKVVYGSNKLKLKLKSNKKYYVRVRAYRESAGTKLYGKWSDVQRIKIKK